MKVLIFGATGMVGQGALRECLLDPEVLEVTAIGRTPFKTENPKLKQLIHPDLWNYAGLEKPLAGLDACLFCLGTPSSGKTEEEYSRVTYDLTMAAARFLAPLNPQMTFIYISGEGADSTEKGKVMWARVRGRLENALFQMPFKGVFVFRPGMILPMDGIQSKTRLYRLFYQALWPLTWIFRVLFPGNIATTRTLGRALVEVAKNGSEKKILKSSDFEKLARKGVRPSSLRPR